MPDDYEAHRDPLYRERMIARLQVNRSFKVVFKRDLTDKFFNMVNGIVHNTNFPQNILLSISGLTGSGKSSIVISLGIKMFPHFSEKNIFFFDQEIIDNAHKFPKKTLIIRDENPAKAIFGEGSTRATGQIVVMSEVCRKAELNLAFIEPSFQPNDIIKYYLETIDMDIKRRITRCSLMDGVTKMYIGSVKIPVVENNNPIWVAYNKRKDDFIDKVKSGNYEGSKLDYISLAKKAKADPDFDMFHTKSEQKAYLVTKYPNYTTGEIQTILALIKTLDRGADL